MNIGTRLANIQALQRLTTAFRVQLIAWTLAIDLLSWARRYKLPSPGVAA
jgi:hypothetical protein